MVSTPLWDPKFSPKADITARPTGDHRRFTPVYRPPVSLTTALVRITWWKSQVGEGNILQEMT